MYIALADSSPGDRKQMERLLERESDRRAGSTGIIYTETFGNREALLNSPSVYDVYFLDVTDEGNNAYDIAVKIREKGITTPIVFCISSIDYRKCGDALPNSRYINKPILTAELSRLLDEIIEEQRINYIPKIEFRDKNESFYLEEKAIRYVEGIGYSMKVHLADGSEKIAGGLIESLWNDLVAFTNFVPLNNQTIVNMRYVKKLEGLNCVLDDGTRLKLKMTYRGTVKKMLEAYKEE